MSEKDSPIAKYAPGLRSIKLYRDGRIEYRGHTGSVVGAAPGVDATGSKRLIRDTREVFLTIEGPSVGISAPLSSKGHLAQTQARKFAAKVNETAMQLGHAATARTTPSPSSPPPNGDILSQLERLGMLRDSGVLTAEEFQTQKSALLRQTAAP